MMGFVEVFERHYDSRMTVEVNKTHKDGNVTKQGWVAILTDIPCRLSKKSHQKTASGDQPLVGYQLYLYCNPSLEVPAGSRITVTDTHGTVRKYKRSSEGFSSYNSHQEILLSREVVA